VRLTFLGTGTSFGVPQIGCGCAVCRSADPRDRRTRVGALVETAAGRRVLLDTPPELRLQLVAAGVDGVDAVLFTHDHADHVHGIDDVRAFTGRSHEPLTMYGSGTPCARSPQVPVHLRRGHPAAARHVQARRGACASWPRASAPRSPGVDVTPVRVPHGSADVFAYRIGPLAYVTDAKRIPDAAAAVLRGARTLVINALFPTPHPTHLSIPEAVAAASGWGPR
jgi:phosphoribosyl 1,2-cyclic phosphate phosphodiesterase